MTDPSLIAVAKAAYTTRHVPLTSLRRVLPGGRPTAGDLVLARVGSLGQHRRLELPDGRRATMHEGDAVIVAYGNRYAPDQFEAVVPDDLDRCDLVAAGGVAGRTLSRHASMLEPTVLEPAGLLADAAGRPVNLRDWRLPEPGPIVHRPHTIAVLGTSMNAGKTTTVAGIIRGLVATGLHVAAAKVTGTGAGGDIWMMVDAGARTVLDFTAAGLPSTYLCELDEVTRCLRTLWGHLAAQRPDVIVLEVADGLYQRETAHLVASDALRQLVDAVVFASGDAMGAVNGVAVLERAGLPVVAVSGLLTASVLAVQEARQHLAVPVHDLDDLIGAPASIRPRRSMELALP